MNDSHSLNLFIALCHASNRTVHDRIGDKYIAPCGAPYIVLTGTGGVTNALEAFRQYAATRPKDGVLYFRCFPELGGQGRPDDLFYMRLCIA